MNFEITHTPRLYLRKYDQETADHVFKNYTDEKLKKFLGIHDVKNLTIAKNRYADGLSSFNRKFLYFHLLEIKTDRVIGWCGYHTWYIDHDRAELGYTIFDQKDMNKGYMSEALKMVIDYGFCKMHLHRIEAFLASYNQPSMKLMQNYKFIREGNLREHYQVDGKMDDSLVFSLLKSDLNEYKIKERSNNSHK
jgi:RimJ/RimL family protein N-acetyltransferase